MGDRKDTFAPKRKVSFNSHLRKWKATVWELLRLVLEVATVLHDRLEAAAAHQRGMDEILEEAKYRLENADPELFSPSLDFHGSTNDAFPLRAPRQNP